MKQKTHSGTKKRTKISSKGKIIFAKSCKRHLLTNKSKGQKSLTSQLAAKADQKKLKALLKK